MNIQRLSESLYNIWKIRLEGMLTYSHGNREDYLPASLFEKVVYYSRIVEQELDSVFFSVEVSNRFSVAIAEIKFHIPYIKTINRTGLMTLPIVGSAEEIERRREAVADLISSPALKKKYINLMNKELRNAFQ